MLKTDDVRLKGMPMATKFCVMCDLGAPDNARHMIMECPALQQMRNVMCNEISGIEDGSGREIINEPGDLLYTLMGKCP